jgi:hypothetical protein
MLIFLRHELEIVSENWKQIPVDVIHQTNFYKKHWQSTCHLENARLSGLNTVLTLEKAAEDLKVKLGIEKRWDETCEEWQNTFQYVVRRDYHCAIEVLEGLVVSCLFELTKMNQSGLCIYCLRPRANIQCLPGLIGYKLCTKIAKALKARKGAIWTAVNRYNACADALPEPCAHLKMNEGRSGVCFPG